MGSKIDVLAVIDREVRRAGGEGYPDGCDLLEVRAAVAELIDEGWNMVASARHTGNSIDPEQLAAALARVKGVE